MDIESMPEPPARKSALAPAGSFSEMNRKLAIVEDRIENIGERISIVEKDSLEKNRALAIEVQSYEEKFQELRKEIERLEGLIEKIVTKLELFAGKEQLKVLERYLNFWNPLDYVSKKDVEELIDSKLKSKSKKKG